MVPKPSFWKYSNLTLFKYNDAKPRDIQSLSDWNRLITAPDKCEYYINGTKLSDLRQEPFVSRKELKEFFKTTLFSQYKGDKLDALLENALDNFHQTGLQHATNFNTNLVSSNSVKCTDPLSRIDFTSTEDGVLVKEDNKYQEIVDKGKKRDLITDPNKYHARTTTQYSFTDKGYEIQSLEIDCPSREVADVFDKRDLWEKISQYISNLIADWKAGPEAESTGMSM
ncbi:hypothetical protein [Legionella maioricensis]|uniref:Uncharacterized protein n=1 Tax=Legionella maioricensis TaxID=2896528 RepID=A0A9X2IAX0_9GAMM|nr:hypothetical protein [Legionella maioricensis]MCL9683945.1 hypothetical protein [Legionella maioricensis]MCL9688289.1 hypothetical protein [Legionella maioricensis]